MGRKFSLTMKIPPAYQAGRAESFPVSGELGLRATSLLRITESRSACPLAEPTER